MTETHASKFKLRFAWIMLLGSKQLQSRCQQQFLNNKFYYFTGQTNQEHLHLWIKSFKSTAFYYNYCILHTQIKYFKNCTKQSDLELHISIPLVHYVQNFPYCILFLRKTTFLPRKWSETPEKIYNCFDETSNNWHLVFLVQTLETTDFQTTPVQNEHQHIQNLSYKNYFITVVFILLLKDNPKVLLRDNHFIHCWLFNIVLISGVAR